MLSSTHSVLPLLLLPDLAYLYDTRYAYPDLVVLSRPRPPAPEGWDKDINTD